MHQEREGSLARFTDNGFDLIRVQVVRVRQFQHGVNRAMHLPASRVGLNADAGATPLHKGAEISHHRFRIKFVIAGKHLEVAKAVIQAPGDRR